MDIPPTGRLKTKRRRRWPWITGAVVLAIFVLAGIFGNKPQTTGTPTIGTVGTVATASSTSSAPTTTATTTVAAPVTTTTVAAVVAPPVVTTVRPVVVVPRTTHHAAPKPPPVVVPPPVVAPPVAPPPPPPAAGRYHAGEFCSTVGATAISSTGAAMTCLQEGKYKRWHNN
jgi:hypothetical protein